MNDDNKTVNQNADPIVQATPVQPQTPVQPVVPVTPVGSPNKEIGPVGSVASEYIKLTDTEPQIDQDLEELGIEAKKENPDLTNEHKQAGIGYAKETAPVSSQPTGAVKLPMSEEEVADTLKTGQDDDSGKWLAGLIQKIIRAMGFSD